MLTYRERTDPALGKPVNCLGWQTTEVRAVKGLAYGTLTTLLMSKSLKATPAAAKDQQGRNYLCERDSVWTFVPNPHLPYSRSNSTEGFRKHVKAVCRRGRQAAATSKKDVGIFIVKHCQYECFTIYNKMDSVLSLVKNSHCYSKSPNSSQTCYPEFPKDLFSPTSYPHPKTPVISSRSPNADSTPIPQENWALPAKFSLHSAESLKGVRARG